MTKIETDLSLILLKLCEETLPKTAVAKDQRFTSLLKQVRQHLEAQVNSKSDRS